MKHVRSTPQKSLRVLTVTIWLMAVVTPLPVSADEYGDITQLLRAGKFNDALIKADQYLQTKPRDAQMRFMKGVAQSESGKPFDAISTFTKLTEDYPELPEPYNNLAVIYASQNQLDKARTALELAIKTNPSYTTAHENLSDVYTKLASQAYSKALQLDANNTGVQPKLALIRELFAPGVKGQRPATGSLSITSPTLPIASSPTTTASKPPAATAVTALPIAPAPVAAAAANKDIESALQSWAAAWTSKDMTDYLGAYAREFVPAGNISRQAWETERRKRILGKSRISVKLSEVTVTTNGDRATARFRQEYAADSLSTRSRKTLELVKSGNRWLIVKEHSGA